jgi:hypothetical protein
MLHLIDSQTRFLSEEDCDLSNLSDEEFDLLASEAFLAAQANNEQDAGLYRHGCTAVEPGWEYLIPLIRCGAL